MRSILIVSDEDLMSLRGRRRLAGWKRRVAVHVRLLFEEERPVQIVAFGPEDGLAETHRRSMKPLRWGQVCQILMMRIEQLQRMK